MSSYTRAWNEAIPTDQTLLGNFYDELQKIKVDFRERMTNYNWTAHELITNMGNVSGALTVDTSLGNAFTMVLTGNITSISLTNASDDHLTSVLLFIKQDSTGGRTLPLATATQIKWPYDTPPTLDTTAGTTTVIALSTIDGGTTWVGALVGSQYDI